MTLPTRMSLRRMHRLPLILSAAAMAIIAQSSLSSMPTLLLWNASPSVPEGLYFVLPGTRPGVGNLAVIALPTAIRSFASSRGYLPSGVLLIKPIVATSQTCVCRDGSRISVNHKTVGIAKSADAHGRPLPVWQGCHRLAAGEVFAMNPAVQDSFDGRYFGPVSAGYVVGRAIPLFTTPLAPATKTVILPANQEPKSCHRSGNSLAYEASLRGQSAR